MDCVVLIVEDDLLIGFDLKELVEEELDATAILTTGHVEAVEALNETIDFVILDAKLADGDAFELARRLVSEQIPFVFVSGYSKDDMPNDLQAAPFLAKPFREQDLVRVARSLIPSLSEKD